YKGQIKGAAMSEEEKWMEKIDREQVIRTETILLLRTKLINLVTMLYQQTQVEHGCWVSRKERIEWIERILADALKRAVDPAPLNLIRGEMRELVRNETDLHCP